MVSYKNFILGVFLAKNGIDLKIFSRILLLHLYIGLVDMFVAWAGEGGISQELMLWTLLNLIKNSPPSRTKIVLVGLQTRNEKTKYKILLPYTIYQPTFHNFNIIMIIQTRIPPVLPLTIVVKW